MNRRGFLGSILAAGVAPWVVKADMLMPVRSITLIEEALPIYRITSEILVQIAKRKGLITEMFTYGALQVDGRSILMPQTTNPGDTLIFRRLLPYRGMDAVPCHTPYDIKIGTYTR